MGRCSIVDGDLIHRLAVGDAVGARGGYCDDFQDPLIDQTPITGR